MSEAPQGPGWRRANEGQAPWLIIGGMAAVAIGCFLPWAKLTGPFVGTATESGIDSDGILFLVGAVAVAGGALVHRASPSRLGWIAIAVLIALLGVGTVYEVLDLRARFADAEAAAAGLLGTDGLISTSFGMGLWVVGFGVVAGAVGWLLLGRPQKDKTLRAPRS